MQLALREKKSKFFLTYYDPQNPPEGLDVPQWGINSLAEKLTPEDEAKFIVLMENAKLDPVKIMSSLAYHNRYKTLEAFMLNKSISDEAVSKALRDLAKSAYEGEGEVVKKVLKKRIFDIDLSDLMIDRNIACMPEVVEILALHPNVTDEAVVEAVSKLLLDSYNQDSTLTGKKILMERSFKCDLSELMTNYKVKETPELIKLLALHSNVSDKAVVEALLVLSKCCHTDDRTTIKEILKERKFNCDLSDLVAEISSQGEAELLEGLINRNGPLEEGQLWDSLATIIKSLHSDENKAAFIRIFLSTYADRPEGFLDPVLGGLRYPSMLTYHFTDQEWYKNFLVKMLSGSTLGAELLGKIIYPLSPETQSFLVEKKVLTQEELKDILDPKD